MSLLEGLFAALAIGLSGLVRGFSGFGFGLVAVPMLSLILDPRQAVGIAMILQATSGFLVLWHSWRAVAWGLMGSLCVGTAGTLWLGLLVLDGAPADTIRLYLAVIVIVAAALIASGVQYRGRLNPPLGAATGAVAGFLNGLSGMGGPPVIVLLLGSRMGAEASRATMSAYFTVLGVFTALGAVVLDHLSQGDLVASAALVPVLLAATAAGTALFGRFGGAWYRPVALTILIGLAISVFARSLVSIGHGEAIGPLELVSDAAMPVVRLL
jgi:hypothetical protein